MTNIYHERSDAVLAICKPRWKNFKQGVTKLDPCDACPLYKPCVQKGAGVTGLQAFNTWIDGINEAALS